jgi:hypothetical protein
MFSRAENSNQNPLSRGKWYCLAPNYIYPNDQIIIWLISTTFVLKIKGSEEIMKNNRLITFGSISQKVGHQNKKIKKQKKYTNADTVPCTQLNNYFM